MSAWGLSDNTTIAGTVTTYAANTNVVGSSTYFTANLNAGDYITISGVTGKNQVQSITSNTALVLENIPRAAVTGKVAFVQQGPKTVHSSNAYALARQSNVLSIENIYGVDSAEIATVAFGSISVNNAGAGYQRLANTTAITANTAITIATTGLSQPQANATATLTFSNNVLTAITVTNPGKGYTAAAQANTTAAIATTGASQPTTNATATINFTSGSTSNAVHTGWNSFYTYTDAYGNPRVKYETLVAMSKNGITSDDEDTKYPD
jgi:hypothetical protein